MKYLSECEPEKRGCYYHCTDTRLISVGKGNFRRYCIHEKCPYRILDKYETYEDYLKSPDSRIDALMR